MFKEKWSKVDEKGYQYNKKGEARFVGEPKCEHVWEEIADRELRCVKCGDRKVIDPPEPTPCEHVWKKETVDGDIYNKCTKCGFMEAIEKTHDCIYGDIQGDGYQYCKICNEAIVPDEIPEPCNHNWEEVERLVQTETRKDGTNSIIGHIFIHKCKKCGKIKTEKTHYE